MRSCCLLAGVARLGDAVLQMLEPLRVPPNLQPVGDDVQGAARDEPGADIAADWGEIALVKITEHLERLRFDLLLGDLRALVVGEWQEETLPPPHQLPVGIPRAPHPQ